jgi:hypothetical protein
MKKLFLFTVLSLIITACGTMGASPTPTPQPTATITPAATKTPIPTPTIETGPEGTVVKTDYLNNKYSVDDQGKPAYWFDEKTDKWQKFEPINFKLWPVDRIIENKIVFSSGWYTEEVKRAIAEGLWQPKNPDVNYIKMPTAPEGSPERLEQERFLWWQEIPLNEDGTINRNGIYDEFNRLKLFAHTDNEEFRYDKYPIQTTSLLSIFKDGNKEYSIYTSILYFETADGEKIQQPIFYKLPNEEARSNSGLELWFGSQFDPQFPPFGLAPLIDHDPNRPDTDFLKKLKEENPVAYESTLRYEAYYSADAQDQDFKIRQDLLLRLYQGDVTVFEELGKHLFSPVPIGL